MNEAPFYTGPKLKWILISYTDSCFFVEIHSDSPGLGGIGRMRIGRSMCILSRGWSPVLVANWNEVEVIIMLLCDRWAGEGDNAKV